MTEALVVSGDLMQKKEAVLDSWNSAEVSDFCDADTLNPQDFKLWAVKRRTAVAWRINILGNLLPDVLTDVMKCVEFERSIIDGSDERAKSDIGSEDYARIGASYSSGEKSPLNAIFMTAIKHVRELRAGIE